MSHPALAGLHETRGEPHPDLRAAVEQALDLARHGPALPRRGWRFRLRAQGVDLLLEPVLVGRDAYAVRTAALSCGSTLCDLVLALRHVGYESDVTLHPDPLHPDLVARLTAGKRTRPSPDTEILLAAAPQRAFAAAARPAPGDAAAVHEAVPDLRRAAQAEGTDLLTAPARSDGPPLLVVATRGDDVGAWLRAGAALERVLLTAAGRRIVALVDTDFAHRDLRRLRIARAAGTALCPQAVLHPSRLPDA